MIPAGGNGFSLVSTERGPMENINIARKDVHDLVCVSLDVHLWSGRKRLRKEALIEKNPTLAALPPESLATLGAIKICDPDDLSPFMRIKRQAEKLLSGSGLPLLGTWGIPDAKVQGAYKQLKALQTEFSDNRAQLYRDFTAHIEDWRNKAENRGWAHLITDIPTPEHVAGKLSFGFHMVRVLAPSDDASDTVNETYVQQVGGLKGELFADAAREARFLMERCLMGKNAAGVVTEKEKITHKTLRPLRRVAEKMRSFSFLDSGVLPMAQVIEHCLSLMPTEGPIEGVHLVHIWTLARTLGNEHAAEEAAALALELGSAGEAFEDLLATTPQAIAAEMGGSQQVVAQAAIQPTGAAVAVLVQTPAPAHFDELQSAFF
jgi:hypothetical protein